MISDDRRRFRGHGWPADRNLAARAAHAHRTAGVCHVALERASYSVTRHYRRRCYRGPASVGDIIVDRQLNYPNRVRGQQIALRVTDR